MRIASLTRLLLAAGAETHAEPGVLGLDSYQWVALAMSVLIGVFIWKKVPGIITGGLDNKIAEIRKALDLLRRSLAEAKGFDPATCIPLGMRNSGSLAGAKLPEPIEALEGQSTLPVPAALLGPGEHYALEVSGDSMIEAGIFDGDFALVKRTDVARDGEIVVALVRDEEATLKYLRRQDGMIRLDPANGAYEPQLYRANEVKVQGKLAGLLRRYH